MNSVASPESSTSTPLVEYMFIDEVEYPWYYRRGGYHPIGIGDQLTDRYRVVHKLGFGTYSTTWLVKDQKTNKYVAVKVTIAEGESPESDILSALTHSKPGDENYPGKNLIPRISDTFSIDGPNGTHKCLVTEPGMMTLREARDASHQGLFQLPVARAIAAQFTQAVAFLHHRGVVHADLHSGNVMLHLPKSIHQLSPQDLNVKYGQPRLEPFKRLDGNPLPNGMPTHGVLPIWLGKASDKFAPSESKIFITDFGESYLPCTTQRDYSHTPVIVAPPEAHFLHESLSFPSEIWTLACTLWEIISTRPLFEGFVPSIDYMLEDHVDTLGKLPDEWWEKWDARGHWFTEDGENTSGDTIRSLEDRFEDYIQEPREKRGMGHMDEAERGAFLSMMRGMLAFRPGERLTAAEVLESEWLVKWALPELEKQKAL